MNREEMRYKLNEVRMMINDGEHGEEQGILVECIKALDSAEGEYIKKEEIKSAIHNFFHGLNHNVTEEDIQAYIDALALYSFPEREKGEWIEVVDEITETTKTWHYECSKCGKPNTCCGDNPKFCPNCGADMRGGKSE